MTYPDCPECRTDVFVENYRGPEGYICQSCRTAFDAPASFRARADD